MSLVRRSRHDVRRIGARLCGAIIAALLLGTGCAAAPHNASTATTLESEVRSAMANFMDALNALDVERIERTFADDVTAFVPNAQSDEAIGRRAVTAIFRTFADRLRPTTPRLHLVPEDERVDVSSTLAVVTFAIHDATPPVTHRRTFIFRRVGDRWLISHFHASDLASPAR